MKTYIPQNWRETYIEALEARHARLQDELEQSRAENQHLQDAFTQARERIRVLERQLGLCSRNSSLPPSRDSETDRTKRTPPKKSGRKPGGQPGHDGHHRKLWPPEKVDETSQIYPDVCSSCGLELRAEQSDGQPTRHQIFELPPIRIHCTELQLHACQCQGCGTKTRAELPEGTSRSGWGPALTALLATLTTVGHMTRRQLDWFVSDVLGAPSSVGSVQTHLEEASEALEPAYHQAKETVADAPWTGVDETGWRLQDQSYWVWLTQSERAAVYSLSERRTKQVAIDVVGETDGRVFITDRYPGYSFLPHERHQLCHAHLLRDMVSMRQRGGPIGAIGEALETLVRDFLREWARMRRGERPRDEVVAWAETVVRPRWQKLLEEARDAPDKEPSVVRWLLRDDRHELAWTCLKYPGVEPTNNSSERALRGPVIQRKISWGSQSPSGLRLMERLWTVTETCRRHERSVLDYITEAVEALRGGKVAPLLIPPPSLQPP